MARGEDRLSILIETQDRASAGLGAIAGKIGALAAAYLTWQTAQRIIQAGIDQIGQAISAASEQEQADRRLALALKNVGDASAKTLNGLRDYAGSLQKVTLFTDDQIQGVQSLLVSLGRLTGAGLERATKATLDLAQGLGIDLDSAARLMAKAAAGSTVALSRYGISVDDSLSKSEKFEQVLSKLERRFGGAAKDAANTFGGSIDRVQKSFSELQEAFGKAIIENPALAAGLKAIADEMDRLTKFVSDPEFQQALSDLVTKIVTLTALGAKFASLLAFSVVPGFTPDDWKELASAIDRISVSIRNAAAPETDQQRLKRFLDMFKEPISGPTLLDDTDKKVLTLSDHFEKLLTLTEDEQFAALAFAGGKFLSGPLELERGIVDTIDPTKIVSDYFERIATNAALTTYQVGEMGRYLEDSVLKLELMQQIQSTLIYAASDFGAQLVASALEGDVALGEMIKNFLIGLAAAIVKMLIIFAIQKAINAASRSNPYAAAIGIAYDVIAGGSLSTTPGGTNQPGGPPISFEPPLATPLVGINLSVMGVTPEFVQEFNTMSAQLARRYGYQVISTGSV